MRRWIRWLAVGLGAGLLAPAAVLADDVLAGLDLWVTPPGGAFHDFADTPIPAGFFDPGSQPFEGVVNLQGDGSGTCGSDTAVSRLGDLVLPGPGSQAFVPIEIVELSLVSVSPIDVVTGPSSTQWDVHVGLSPFPQPQGGMTVRHINPNGGTYTSQLPVCPLFTFTQVGNPSNQVQLDTCQVPFPPVEVTAANSLWTHLVQLPLVCGGVSTPNFIAKGPHQGPHPGAEPLEQITPHIPSVGSGLLVAAALLMIGVAGCGTVWVSRRRRGVGTA